MTIRARLWIGFGLMMAAIVALAVLALAALIAVDREYSEMLDIRHQRVTEALRLKSASQAEILAARSYLLTGDLAFLDAMRQADEEQRGVLAALRGLSANDDSSLLDAFEAAASAYDRTSGDVPEQTRAPGAAEPDLSGEPAKRELTALLDRYIAEQQATLDETSAEATRSVRRAVLALVIGALVAVVAAAGAAWLTAREIVVPLGRLIAAARALQSGRPDQPPLPQSLDEIGELGRAFGEMRRAVADREAALAAERARAESILLSLDEGLCLLDAKGWVAYANPRLGHLLGRAPSTLIDRSASDVLAELSTLIAEPRRAGQRVLHALRTADPRVPVDVALTHSERWLRLTVFPVRGTAGERIGRGIALRDVTAERASDRLHATFLNLVSHELRTPLGAIKGFTSALRQEDLPLDGATRREFLGGIEAGADQLTRIVAEILDLSRIEAGALTVQRERCTARELAQSALEDLSPELTPDDRVRMTIPSHLPSLMADPLLTRQALRGLLDNALRYSPPRGTVRLTAHHENDQVIIRIADRGPGLPPVELSRIFEPFYRAGRSEDGGLGLGLAICRGLVRAQGGDISGESRRGAGTTFSVALPTAPMPHGGEKSS